MKVAYNACYGGFGLSKDALITLAELKGVDLSGMEYSHTTFHDEQYKNTFSGPEDRSDKDLIKVIETLGDKASGTCAKIAIQEIPDGAKFEIDEYDGFEAVVPPRQSW